MSVINHWDTLNYLVMKPGDEYERLARIRERQRRQRKEELYSYHTKKQRSVFK
jgi:hypothetical protein